MKVLAAMKAIIKKENGFLVLEHDFNGVKILDLPGGKIEYNEDPIDTLRREIKEETSLDVEIIKPLGVIWFFRKSDNNQVVCFTYLCKPLSENIDLTKNPAKEKIIDYKWVDFDDSDKLRLDFKGIEKVINIAKKKF